MLGLKTKGCRHMVRLPLSEGPYLTEGAHTPKGHSCPGGLGLGVKDISISDLHGEEGLKPKWVSLARVLILPHLVPAQASMKENLVALPQSSPEMSLPYPHPVPVPSLPKSIHTFPSLTPWVTVPIVKHPDSSSPCSRVFCSSHPGPLQEKVQGLPRRPVD